MFEEKLEELIGLDLGSEVPGVYASCGKEQEDRQHREQDVEDVGDKVHVVHSED